MNKNSQSDQLDKLLGTLFFRRSCPDAEVLGDYHMNLLAPGQRLVVALHLRFCPHCSAELAHYADDVDTKENWLAQIQRGISDVRWATATSEMLPAMRSRGIHPQIYQIDDTTIRLLMEPATVGYRRWKLTGRLEPVVDINQVTLWPDQIDTEDQTKSCTLNEGGGYFTFEQLAVGSYYLCFRNEQSEIWLGAMDIGSPY